MDHNVYAIKSPRTGLAQNDPPNRPQLAITPGQSVASGTEVTFDASASTDPNPGDQLFFTWDLGDGTLATGPIVHHTYWNSNTYQVTLTASDGMASTTLNPKPNITVSGGGLAYFCDGFNRGNNTSLGSPGTGSALGFPCPASSSLAWEEELMPPSIGTQMSINSNQLINDPVKTTHMATVSAYSGSDQVVATQFTSTYTGTAPRFGILLRFVDAQNYYVAYRSTGGASVLRIAKVVNGVETVLSQVPLANPAVNAAFRLRASVATTAGSGAALTLQLCPSLTSCAAGTGTTATATVSSSPFSGGGVGLQLMWSTSTAPSYIMDNFKACVGGPGANCSAIE